jgi:hypothetical protein
MWARHQRWVWSFVGSLVVHGLVAALAQWAPEAPPPEPPLQLTLLAPDPAEATDGAPPPLGAPPAAPPPAPSAAAVRPRTPTSVPPAPGGERPLPAPEPTPATPEPPRSFRDWRRSRATTHLPAGNPFGAGSAGAAGTGTGEMASRNRCEPAPGRRFDTLYLLFDSSGSMSSALRAEALSCAHQYAQASIRDGASVVIGNFARDAHFTGPTRSMVDVEFAIRGTVDGSATILPWAQLEPYLDRDEGHAAELVIVSDGMFATDPEVLRWYRSFLARSPDHRATMYAVGPPGEIQAVGRLERTGMDVFLYERIRRP